MWFAEHDVPRESSADDGETVPRRAEIVDDTVLRQLDRTLVSAFNAFWWLTMYELASSLLYANLLNRYVSNAVDPKRVFRENARVRGTGACSPASCGHRPVRPARRNCLRG
jgi:hypothetical protein